jgi:Txe/YoeB family toxin of Txe-Axe toxin-antitoxin module
LKEVKDMIKKFNDDDRQKDQLDEIYENFEELIKEAQRDTFEMKKGENRILTNMDDVWDKIHHEMQIISES